MKEWRFCNKCFGMFFDGRDSKGRCPAGGSHVAQGLNFDLPKGNGDTASGQANWRWCAKCFGMMFDGYPEKGTCAGGGAHDPGHNINFLLQHDTREEPGFQGSWRFCNKCMSLFFDGYPEKGRCASGGGHQAQGYNFVLPTFPRPQRIDDNP
jgi:hypothetical protein